MVIKEILPACVRIEAIDPTIVLTMAVSASDIIHDLGALDILNVKGLKMFEIDALRHMNACQTSMNPSRCCPILELHCDSSCPCGLVLALHSTRILRTVRHGRGGCLSV